jgi:hypothetical protein
VLSSVIRGSERRRDEDAGSRQLGNWEIQPLSKRLTVAPSCTLVTASRGTLYGLESGGKTGSKHASGVRRRRLVIPRFACLPVRLLDGASTSAPATLKLTWSASACASRPAGGGPRRAA